MASVRIGGREIEVTNVHFLGDSVVFQVDAGHYGVFENQRDTFSMLKDGIRTRLAIQNIDTHMASITVKALIC